MNSVHVVGAGMIAFGRHKESTYSGLAVPAVLAALKSSGIDRKEIDSVFCASSFAGLLPGQRVTRDLGIAGIPVVNVENACSGGATALHLAHAAVAQGKSRIALVVGVEKLTQFGGGAIPLSSEDVEARAGLVMPAVYAMRARRYMHERGASEQDLAEVAVKARRHGALNPYARFQSETTVDEVLTSRPIADPLTLLQCCPTCDGAAAVLVVSDDVRRTLSQAAIRIMSSVLHSGSLALGYRDMLRPEITMHSARDAYADAGLTATDLDVVELHDAFTVAELVYYEALGLCETGEAVEMLRSGATSLGGEVAVNPGGGLLSRGHPVGASGVAQVAEVFWQLTDQAGERQVANARHAMTHVTGGGLSWLDHGSCCIHIFEGEA
ncbi:thiolase family protein [Rhodococcoides kyotonense]|uniref:propanoyl-CoA C-acyltransferase n=1 Tax=Rhodococcoides kyotonense TaxID=398843 RepID=A0A239M0K9_9NOCA|nr:thiolase family protein [Rhodococcus kyotonensis]SNT36286.1 benzoylsuccinyl-CoA thiolase BbsB subunit [Rhodococcus kyotonensis]